MKARLSAASWPKTKPTRLNPKSSKGTVSLVFPTGHTIGLKSKTGAEILIHIGMDTVELNGEGFEVLVSKDQEVKAGQPLVKFDLDAIKAKGYDLTTPVIITNSKSYQEIGDSKRDAVKAGDQLLALS
ncbi:PTS sugar transporter subunit IIA [Lactobacillus delbrueckii]|uniref:PTS sugar transporter subunit IIA n=1 Tax=Lactobacillus delbrueckii TaxID=1584 RepID=UPI003A8520CB